MLFHLFAYYKFKLADENCKAQLRDGICCKVNTKQKLIRIKRLAREFRCFSSTVFLAHRHRVRHFMRALTQQLLLCYYAFAELSKSLTYCHSSSCSLESNGRSDKFYFACCDRYLQRHCRPSQLMPHIYLPNIFSRIFLIIWVS